MCRFISALSFLLCVVNIWQVYLCILYVILCVCGRVRMRSASVSVCIPQHEKLLFLSSKSYTCQDGRLVRGLGSICALPQKNEHLFPTQVRRWMRNPKVSVEKAQGKGHLYSCPKCPLAEDQWYTHFPSPYGCCHYSGLQGGQYYHPEPCSPCPASGQSSSHDKSKGCKVQGKTNTDGEGERACVHECICVTPHCPFHFHLSVSFVTSILHTVM